MHNIRISQFTEQIYIPIKFCHKNSKFYAVKKKKSIWIKMESTSYF